MRWLAFILCSIIGAFCAQAETAGENAPAFRAALSQWLDGQNDLAALHEFATLAREGNTAAQITLGLIERNVAQKAHVIADMSRDDRRAIFRDPEGPFGDPWLRVAGQTNAYAAVRVAPMSAENIMTGFAAALAHQDLRFAWELAMIDFNRTGLPSSAHRLAHPLLLPHGAAVLASMLSIFDDPVTVGKLSTEEREALTVTRAVLESYSVRMALLPALSTPLHRLSDLEATPEVLRQIGEPLLGDPAVRHVSAIVREACPNDSALHMGVTASAISLFPLTLLQESPLVPVVDSETWQQSARFQRDFLREVMAFEAHRTLVERLSPCLFHAAE